MASDIAFGSADADPHLTGSAATLVRRRRWEIAVVAAVGGAAALLASWLLARSGFPLSDIVLTVATGSAFIGCGLIIWARYPNIATGRLLVLTGFASYTGALAGFRSYWLAFAAFWLRALFSPLWTHAVLSFPGGRMKPAARAVVGITWAWTLAGGLATALTYDPLVYVGCDCPRPGPFPPVIENHELAVAVDAIYNYGWAVIAVALLSVVVWQWIRASPSTRRAAMPVWSLTGLILVLLVMGHLPISFEAAEAAGWVVDVAFLLTPFAFLAGLLGMRLDSVGVGRLAVDLAADPRPGRVRYLLARALRDPGLGIAFWVRDASGYVDEAGLPISEPAWAAGRAVTRISADDAPLAMLAHNPELTEQRELIDVVTAVARLALENERLHAEVLAQLEEVRASRVRLVDAADAERRRVERNLHDGAQQRLVALSLVLGQAQSLAVAGDSELATTLADASEELRRALAELRELARGIHPTLLTEDGLVAAAESLAERSPIPVVVSSELKGRLPSHVEATGYFVVAEALANIVRHAGASQAMVSFTTADGLLRVEVHDDGRGGADPGAGSGLRGLEDRVVALGGTLSIDSSPEIGTRVVAVLPCG